MPFDTIYAHVLRYLADLAEGKTRGPGALLYRIHHPEAFPPRALSVADYEDALYAAAWGGDPDAAARRRRRYYVPEGYEDLINP